MKREYNYKNHNMIVYFHFLFEKFLMKTSHLKRTIKTRKKSVAHIYKRIR